MDVARIMSRAQIGLHSPLVHVEVHLGSGLPVFSIVGLAATAVKESKERVRSALANSKFDFPSGRITVNLAPADVPKEGGRFDLPIALGMLVASGQLKVPEASAVLTRCEFYGELALDGELKSVPGMLLAAAHASRARHELILPCADADEASVSAPHMVRGARRLLDVFRHVQGSEELPVHDGRLLTSHRPASAHFDLLDIRGQLQAKRALVVAAAGDHSLLLVGPPGSGKSMLAQRLPGLLPPLSDAEALESAMIVSASANGFDRSAYGRRPYRSPHHTASVFAMIGGGSHAGPGEISLAHRGVLFLDELPEFDRRTLEALREPLEMGVVAVSRVAARAEYPAEFQLIAAMNPCPCGFLGDVSERCECTPGRIAAYRARVSGPLLDRVDLRIAVPTLRPHELCEEVPTGPSSAEAAAQVSAARERQLARAGKANARLSVSDLGLYCHLDPASERLFWQSQAQLALSARSYHRTLRVARTIADLAASEPIRAEHIAEALQLKRALE
ncbi:MAG: YifB family Mg chelatase-like AAA ATPase [Gammaproteobacteria bacterium]